MTQTILDAAKNYTPKKLKNIADLEVIPVNIEYSEKTVNEGEEDEYSYKYIELNGEEYRVPDKVIKDLKAILEKKPNLKTFSVSKSGEGMKTQYTVIPLE